MTKIDMKKTLKTCYSAKAAPGLVEVPAITYVTYEGHGDPNSSPLFQEAMPVLYGLAYGLKFGAKADGRDFTVMPLEGQWWAHDPSAFREVRRDEWKWKVMIALPDFIDQPMFDGAVKQLREKKNPEGLDKARLEVIEDGLSGQIMHIGPYSEEEPTIDELHAFVAESGYRLRGHHREIYLSSPGRTAPEKLKTIVRHPVERA